MKRHLCLILAALLLAALLTACWPTENPPTVHVVYKGQLYEVTSYPSETTACGDLDETKLIDATIIPDNVMPSREGEVNVNAKSVRLYDLNERQFLVIIDGEQYPVTIQ